MRSLRCKLQSKQLTETGDHHSVVCVDQQSTSPMAKNEQSDDDDKTLFSFQPAVFSRKMSLFMHKIAYHEQ